MERLQIMYDLVDKLPYKETPISYCPKAITLHLDRTYLQQ